MRPDGHSGKAKRHSAGTGTRGPAGFCCRRPRARVASGSEARRPRTSGRAPGLAPPPRGLPRNGDGDSRYLSGAAGLRYGGLRGPVFGSRKARASGDPHLGERLGPSVAFSRASARPRWAGG